MTAPTPSRAQIIHLASGRVVMRCIIHKHGTCYVSVDGVLVEVYKRRVETVWRETV